MDYEHHMPGRSSYDPSRASMQAPREGGVGGVLILVGIIAAALFLVIWLASWNTGDAPAPATGVTDPAVTAPADPALTAPVDPAATAPADTVTPAEPGAATTAPE